MLSLQGVMCELSNTYLIHSLGAGDSLDFKVPDVHIVNSECENDAQPRPGVTFCKLYHLGFEMF